ncbi:SsgA family sporulation/cell division regulator [Streptomyces cadmiisoli]|uniref:SsgA family sporulation/cell division regulator n=1 Tax=Streptomyces cadmiisoli TaxID=2184053 RepID=UPI003647376E
MRLHYAAHDPYAVRATFSPLGRQGTVEWVFSREVLAEGMTAHAGHGDIRVWPGVGAARDVLHIALSSPAGSALIEASLQDVRLFLEESQSVVPLGGESRQFDLDTEVAHLLAGG